MKTDQHKNKIIKHRNMIAIQIELSLIILLGLSSCSDIYSMIIPSSPSPAFHIPPTPTPLYLYIQKKEDSRPISPILALARWLKGIPCERPCWEGVTPGKTTYFEAARIWSANPLFRKVSIHENDEGDRLYFELNTSSYSYQGVAPYGLSNLQNPLYLIRIYGIFKEVKLKDLVKAFGQPSHVIATIISNQAFGTQWIINIIWMTKGFSISYFAPLPPPNIDENLSLQQGSYFSPGLEGFQSTDMARDLNGSYFILRPWHGYDTFEGYVFSNQLKLQLNY